MASRGVVPMKDLKASARKLLSNRPLAVIVAVIVVKPWFKLKSNTM